MTNSQTRPLIDEAGEARTPTSAEWQWFVSASDFASLDVVEAFLEAREAFLVAAEEAGIPRNVFLAFQPTKPGFVERAEGALEHLLAKSRAARNAAE